VLTGKCADFIRIEIDPLVFYARKVLHTSSFFHDRLSHISNYSFDFTLFHATQTRFIIVTNVC